MVGACADADDCAACPDGLCVAGAWRPLPPAGIDEGFESGAFNPLFDAGDPAWTIDGTGPIEGTASAYAPDIDDDDESASMSLGLQVAAPSLPRFRYRIDSEAGFDFLVVRVDGQVAVTASGRGGEDVELGLEPGLRTITWSYEKDESVSHGRDTVWIDAIELVPACDTGDACSVGLPAGDACLVCPASDGAARGDGQCLAGTCRAGACQAEPADDCIGPTWAPGRRAGSSTRTPARPPSRSSAT